jgi:hypothetical protein
MSAPPSTEQMGGLRPHGTYKADNPAAFTRIRKFTALVRGQFGGAAPETHATAGAASEIAVSWRW